VAFGPEAVTTWRPTSRAFTTRKGTGVAVRDLFRPLPGVRQLSLLRQRAAFRGYRAVLSARYWERNYARGGTSGLGSYHALAEAKAAFLNDFVRIRQIGSVIEFGCGDGNQLSLANCPTYVIDHLTEDEVFESDMTHRFGAGGRYVIIYAANGERRGTAPHVRHRHFTSWVEACRPDWKLAEVTQGGDPGPDRADFFTYERARPPDADPRWR
jgi:hypothetical protein